MLTPVEKVYNLTESILDFIVDINYLKSVTVLHIFNVVLQIQNVIAPLLPRQHITSYLLQCLLDTEAALLAVRRNLNEWNDGRSKPLRAVITGRSTTKELKEDRDYLITKHSALQGAVQLVTHVHGYNIVTPTSSIRNHMENKSVQSLKMKMKMTDTDQASIFEADQYWRSHFGDEVRFLANPIPFHENNLISHHLRRAKSFSRFSLYGWESHLTNSRRNASFSDSMRQTPGVFPFRHFRHSFDKETSETQSTYTRQVRNAY